MTTDTNLEKPKGAFKFFIYLLAASFLVILIRLIIQEQFGK